MPHRTALIIGFTPYHSLVAARIIEGLDGEIFCAFTKNWPTSANSYKKIGYFQRHLDGSWKNILLMLNFFLLINWWKLTKRPFDIYIPHPCHLLTNPVYWMQSKHRKLYLYEDGLLNYYDADTSCNCIGWSKRVILLLFGFRFKSYIGHLSGCEQKPFDGAYLSQPDSAVCRDSLGKIEQFSLQHQYFSPRPNTILFLDQNTSTHLTDDQRIKCLSQLFLAFPTDVYKYYYKPHHDHASPLQSTMTALPERMQLMPAELLAEELHPSHIVSFYSSALMNIKNAHPNVQCISIAAKHLTISRDGEKSVLSNLFQHISITCL